MNDSRTMNGNAETTSNSIKFAPMPMSALIDCLLPLQIHSDVSFSSADESDNSFGETGSKKASPARVNKGSMTPNLRVSKAPDIKAFASEKKVIRSDISNKENKPVHQQFSSHKGHKIVHLEASKQVVHSETSEIKKQLTSVFPGSEIKNQNYLTSNSSSLKLEQHKVPPVHINTPEIVKPQSSTVKATPKSKAATPKIKSGIRKFTPGSGRHSNKKTPQAVLVNKDKVRCELFSQNRKDEPFCPPPKSVPTTPLNRKPIPAPCVATPSYPQGVIGNNSKILFKTTSIKDKKYMFIKKLGTGGSSEVYKVLEVGTSCEYAVKCVYLAADQDLAQGYINEVRLLRELQNSDRVIKLYDYEYDRANQFLRIVLEAGETDLSSLLRARGGALPPALVLHYWEEMLRAVSYIHENGVIHADLKPANFLLVCGRLKLIDFGIASAISSDATSVVRAQAAGTYSYISPEALLGGAGGAGPQASAGAPIKISFRSDVWSLGCILYSLAYGRTPFGHIPNLAKLAAILDPHHRIDYPPHDQLPQTLIAALKWCLTYNARARPSVRELLAIPYLQGAAGGAGGGAPLPAPLLEKLRTLVTPQEFKLLQRAHVS